ncbi:MAG: GNAT family N-acetyltransferase [Runella sp.]|jgi:ribosomal protein S18 acetylase RimI-like enzyme|uniref:GNAT family N-acetyltransferase n=1 Tax=Runella sp. TaxID=1960881 RepID=UPI002626B5C6|nr:GNAT family N-acetyltransferase [Runella sp.]
MRTLEVIPIRTIQKINQLGCQTYLPHYPHLWYEGGVEWYLNKCFNDRQLELDLANPLLSYYAIGWEGHEVGLLKLVRNKAPFGLNPDTSLYLEKIYFLKEFTGLGLGQKTMNWVFEQAQNSAIKTVWLMAMDTSHKAISSYEKAGFQQMGTTRLDDEEFQRMKPEFRGMVILKKDLF